MQRSSFLAHTLSIVSILCVSTILSLPTADAEQDNRHIALPEGAKARLGKGSINAIAYSPNDTRLAVSSSLGIWMYDTDSGEELGLFIAWHPNIGMPAAPVSIGDITYSPDGRTIASAGYDDAIRLWDAGTGEIKATLIGHKSSVSCIAFSPDGNTLATGGGYQDKTIRLWDVHTEQQKAILTGHESRVSCIAFSPDGNTLATGGDYEDTTLRLWDVHTAQQKAILTEHRSTIYSVAFSPDGNTLVSGGSGENERVRLWNVHTGQQEKTLTGHDSTIYSVAFSPDGNTLVSGSENGYLLLWDTVNWTQKAVLRYPNDVRNMAFSPDGDILAIANWTEVELWDVVKGISESVLTKRLDAPLSAAFSPDGQILACGSRDGTVQLWNVDTQERITSLPAPPLLRYGSWGWHPWRVENIAFSPNGKTLATTGNYQVYLWERVPNDSRWCQKAVLTGHTNIVLTLAFSPDGSLLASGSGDRTVKVFDTESGQHQTTIKHNQYVRGIAFSPDGTTLASGGNDGTIRLWDAVTGERKSTLTGPTILVTDVAYSPDGKTLASSGSWRDKTVLLWDVITGTHKAPLTHTADITLVAFSPDGSTLAGGSGDGTVLLWDAHTGALKRTLTGHASSISSIVFSPDGDTLASTSYDSTVLLWELAPPVEMLPPAAAGNSDRIVNVQDITIAQDVPQWHLPQGAKARFGKGGISGDIVFSPDSTQFAVATQLGIWMYDTYTQKALKLYTGHPEEVWRVAFSPDGKTLASCGGWGYTKIHLWETDTGEHKATLAGHAQEVNDIAFAPDGRLLASSSDDGHIFLWDTLTRMPIASFAGNDDTGINAIAFSPDGQTLASAGWDARIWLWDIDTRQNIATLDAHRPSIDALAFSPDGKTLASGGWDATIRLWDVESHTLKAELSGPTRRVWSLAFSPDGHTLASSSDDGTLFLWEVHSGIHKATLTGHTRPTQSITFSPNGFTLASASQDGTIRLWDGISGDQRATIAGHAVEVSSLAFSPDGYTLATSGWDSLVQLWDIVAPAPLKAISTGHLEGVESIAFSPDGRTLASGGSSGWAENKVLLWDVRDASVLGASASECKFPIFSNHKAAFLPDLSTVSTVIFSPDGTTLAVSERYRNTIILLDAATGDHKAVLSTPQTHNSDGVATIAFSPDGKTLASGSYRNLRLWDIPSATLKATLEGHLHWISSIAFSPDGTTLASSSRSGTAVGLWDIARATQIATLNGHTGGALSVAFSPDGNTLATGGTYKDSTVQLWDVPNIRHKATFVGHRYGVNNLAFSPDSRTLASSAGDGTVLLWEVPLAAKTLGAALQVAVDANADGTVDIHDLLFVASQSANSRNSRIKLKRVAGIPTYALPSRSPNADVNNDGYVDIADLVYVAGTLAGDPHVSGFNSQAVMLLSATEVQEWLTQAHSLESTDLILHRGIQTLTHLLMLLIPTETSVLQNYPNPFNPETWIPYQLAAPADVTVFIYAVDGKLVRTLKLGQQAIGIYESRNRAAYWDGRNELGEPVGSGVYFYTLAAGQFTATRKMVIRK